MLGLGLLVAATLLPLWAAQTTVKEPARLDGISRIVFLGDSITQQGEYPGGYVWLIRQSLDALYPGAKINVVNAGVSGNKSTDMLSRFQSDVLAVHPDLVFVSVGVNDVWHGFYDGHSSGDGPLGISLEDYRGNVQKMISRAREAHARVVLLMATPIGEDPSAAENVKQASYNRALQDLAAQNGCGIVDLQTPFRRLIATYRETTGSTQNFLTVDGVHMNSQGNQVMAQTILTYLGVSDSARNSVHDEIQRRMIASRPHPGPLPIGVILSDNRSASASSVYSVQYGPEQANRAGKSFEQRWCAHTGDFVPNPWWQVDLGRSRSLTGIHIVFAPDDPDTWKYKVQISDDGTKFRDVIDQSSSNQFFSEENHLFPVKTTGRYVRVLFIAPTNAQNWASLRHVQVYGE